MVRWCDVMWSNVKQSYSYHPREDYFPITAHPSKACSQKSFILDSCKLVCSLGCCVIRFDMIAVLTLKIIHTVEPWFLSTIHS